MTGYVSSRCRHCGQSFSQLFDGLTTAYCSPGCTTADEEAQPGRNDTLRELWIDLITEDGRLALEGDETSGELRQALSYLRDAA